MIPLVAERISEVAEICRRHHVKRLEVFGSAAVGDFDPDSSDIDFLVDFGDAPRKPWYGNHFELKEELQELFQREVDLIDDIAIKNPYFRKSVDDTRKQIYPTSHFPSPLCSESGREQAKQRSQEMPKTYLWEIQQAAQSITEFTADTSYDQFKEDWLTLGAVERQLTVIGQAMAGLEERYSSIAIGISAHKSFIDFGNDLIHRYDEIQSQKVWEIIQRKLPTLLNEVTNLLEQPNS